ILHLVYVPVFSASQFLFFFSSRRRHTRSKRDWSSDVCSSDLSCWKSFYSGTKIEGFPTGADARILANVGEMSTIILGPGSIRQRSEERRVGKECRRGMAREC